MKVGEISGGKKFVCGYGGGFGGVLTKIFMVMRPYWWSSYI